MPSTYNKHLASRGFTELVLLLLLSIILIQIDALWTVSKIALREERTSKTILESINKEMLELEDKLKLDPELKLLPTLIKGQKTRLLRPNSIHTLAIADEGTTLNYLYLDSLSPNKITCSKQNTNSPSTCLIQEANINSFNLSEFALTNIRNLTLDTSNPESYLITAGELNINNLKLNILNKNATGYIVLSSYNKLSISKILGTLPPNFHLLVYSILGPVEIGDKGSTEVCFNGNNGNIVFITPSLKIAGKNRENLILSNNSCLKHFPKNLFTSIKIASIH